MSQKGFALVYVLIGIVVLVISGLIFHRLNPKVKDQILTQNNITKIDSTPSSQQSPSVMPLASLTSTAGWKTYTHQDMKISFKYPLDVIIDRNESSVLWFAKSTEEKQDFRNRSIWVEIYEQDTPIETLLSNSRCKNNCKKIYINNLSGFADDSNSSHTNYYLINKNRPNKVLDIRFDVWKPVVQEDKDKFMTIISTLGSSANN